MGPKIPTRDSATLKNLLMVMKKGRVNLLASNQRFLFGEAS